MKSNPLVMILILTGFLLAAILPVFAESFTTDIDAEFRWRGEADGKDFIDTTDMAAYSHLRARLGVGIRQHDVSGYLQFQYPHKLGWNSSSLDADTNGIDIHQAYLKVSTFFVEGLSVKLGRTEMKYGDERLIGPVGWSNTGRVFDGIVFRYSGSPLYWTDLFFTKLEENSDASSSLGKEKDYLFIGLWGQFTPMNLNAFILHNRNAGLTADTTWKSELSRSTLGIHYAAKFDSGISGLFDYAFQTGKIWDLDLTVNNETDISAWMLLLGVVYHRQGPMKLSIGAGVDMTSGDDLTTLDKNEAFDNLYYTGHKWRGYMDYFAKETAANGSVWDKGLRDIFISLSLSPNPKMNAKLVFHNFATSQNYFSATDPSSAVSGLGNEIDVVMSFSGIEALNMSAGLGYFMPTEDWMGKDASDALWLFVQLTTNFHKCTCGGKGDCG